MNAKAKALYDLYTAEPPKNLYRNGFTAAYRRGRDFPCRTDVAPPKNEAAYGAWMAGVHASKVS